MNELMLSIYVAAYNHEKYISKALDSILMQETQYSYEVLVGEDCSQDGTRAVLKEYEAKYPGKFQMLYREHNMYHEKINNNEDLRRRCRGKYIVALEGDDFWTDPQKLEKQITFLESHPEYIAVAHKCIVVDKDSKPNGEEYPDCKEEEYSVRHLASEILPGQLATVMYRNFFATDIVDRSLCEKQIMPEDQSTYFSLITHGRIYCMSDVMSAYRHITAEGTSFSATNRYRYEAGERLTQAFIEYADKIQHWEAKKYAEFMFARNVYIGVKAKQVSIKEAIQKINMLSNKYVALALCIKFIVNKKILKKAVRV